MSAINNILSLIENLSVKEKATLKAHLLNDSNTSDVNMEEFITNERFSSGRACPICGSIHVV